MKRQLLFIISLTVSLLLTAAPVSQESARLKASRFLSAKGPAKARGQQELQAAAATRSYYVFNIGKANGFVMVSADDRTPEILGYADRGTFDSSNVPANLRAWLKGYDDQMQHLDGHPRAAALQKTVTGGAISPLLGNTKWDQGSPYNDLCPTQEIDNGDGPTTVHCVTGCVATAMAQIMYYHRYPAQTRTAIAAYQTGDGISVSGFDITTFDWDNMLPAYNGSETDAQKEAVARLMAVCGAAVHMGYTAWASGAMTWNMDQVLRDYFGFDAGTKTIDRNSYKAAKWNQTIYDELAAGRPVFYSGQSSGGGHAFVIDGYDQDDFFHVNWGWSGSSNGYFLLSVLDPGANAGIGASTSSDGYSFDQDATIRIQPDTGVEPADKYVMATYNVVGFTELNDDGTPIPATEVQRASTEENFGLGVSFSAYNAAGEACSFDIGIGVYDADDNAIQTEMLFTSGELNPNWGYSGLSQVIQFGAGLTSGTYYVMPISRKAGATEWLQNRYTDTNRLTVTIDGNTMTVEGYSENVNLTAQLNATGATEVGTIMPLTLTVTNNGSYFGQNVFLYVNGEFMGGKRLEAEPGETTTVGFGFTPRQAGSYECSAVYLAGYDEDWNPINVTIASTTVEVSAAPAADLTISATLSNAVENVVKENKIVVSANVTNNGTETYNNAVIAILYKLREDGSNIGDWAGESSQTISLAGGQTTNVELTFNDLDDGAYYFTWLYYISEGSYAGGAYGGGAWVQVASEPTYPEGDVNHDGKVNSSDVVAIYNFMAGLPGAPAEADCDVNHDGTVNSSDVVAVYNIMAGK